MTHSIFVELLADGCEALGRLRAPYRLRPWLGAVARQQAWRAVKVRRLPRAPEEPAYLPAQERSVLSDVARIETCEQVARGFDALGHRDRHALALFHKAGLSYRELARELGVPVGRVGTVLMRARERLAKKLDPACPRP